MRALAGGRRCPFRPQWRCRRRERRQPVPIRV